MLQIAPTEAHVPRRLWESVCSYEFGQ